MTASPPIAELVILTPSYAPAIGGAAVYYPLLAEMLLDTGVAARVTVLTERHPGRSPVETASQGRLTVRRLRPYRAGCPTRQRTRHLRYLLGDLTHAGLLRRSWAGRRTLLVHASLHYHPTLLDHVVRRLQRRGDRPRLVADVRDPLLPVRAFDRLAPYDAVIACGRRVTAHLAADPAVAAKLTEIPVPLGPVPPPADPDATARRYGLRPDRDILWPHGVLRRKNLDLALAAIRELRAGEQPDAALAIAGGARDWDARLAAERARGAVRYLGPVAPADMPALAAASAGVIDIAANEGMPRAMLTALAAGARVLLPPGVPEFAACCPGHVADTRSPAALAVQLGRLRRGPWPAAPYPVDAHAAARVAPAYRTVLTPRAEVVPCAS